MKYSKQDADEIIACFQRFIRYPIRILNYYSQEVFHVYNIEPICINGTMRCKIRFKDNLVSDYKVCRAMPDVLELIEKCFIKC